MTTRKPSHGFLLGKFMPPHKGHVFVAETGCNMVDVMTVLVCSTDAEPMDGAGRFATLQECLPRARVKHLHRNLPQAPEDDPAFWSIWQAVCQEMHPEPIDYVFGSERYIFKLAKVLKAIPVLIDPDREVFNISASDIRADPDQHVAMLAKPMPAGKPKRICLLGPESSGKSVLAKKLAAAFKAPLMPEYGRIYDEWYKQTGNDERQWRADDLVMLGRTHMAMRQALSGHAPNILIEDTDLLQTAIWETQLLGTQSPQMAALLADYQPADFYLILSPTMPFKQDGGRYFADMKTRTAFFEQAIEMVQKDGVPHAVIDQQNWTQRNKVTRQAVKAFLEQ